MKFCGSTNVETRADLVVVAPIHKDSKGQVHYVPKVKHAGTIAHRCRLEDHNPEEVNCECECGARWKRNFK